MLYAKYEPYQEDSGEGGVILDQDNSTSSNKKPGSNPDTGDSFNMLPFLIMLSVSGLGVAITFTRRKVCDK